MLNTKDRRSAVLKEATSGLENLTRCILWLLENGQQIISFSGARINEQDVFTIKALAHPTLYMLLKDAKTTMRRQHGEYTIFTWCATAFGIRIEWEEIGYAN